MPGPRWLARFNRSFTNRLTLPLAPWLPSFGVVVHIGRKSGRIYRTPVNVFRTGERRFVFALTYGPKTEWVQNILARGGAHLEYHGAVLTLEHPRLIRDPSKQPAPPLVRLPLSLLKVNDFLEVSVADPASRPTEQPLDVRREP
jgi:deazaflavin-dependent oxidoreductase (nitroreductase family)